MCAKKRCKKMRKNIFVIKIENAIVNLFIIEAFLSLSPYFVWSDYHFGQIGQYFTRIIELLIVLLVMVGRGRALVNLRNKIGICAFFLVMFQAYIILNISLPITMLNIYSRMSKFIVMAIFVVLYEDVQAKIFEGFFVIFTISLLPAIFILMIHYLGVSFPYTVFRSSVDSVTSITSNYRVYPGAVYYSTSYMSIINDWRLCGMFNEPGIVGTFSALFTVIYLKTRKKFKSRAVVLFAGILSFSLAFFLLTIIGSALKIVKKHKMRLLAIIVFIYLGYSIFMTINFNNPSLANIQQRVTISNGMLVGDNREHESFAGEFERFLESDFKTVCFGMGDGAKAANLAMASSSTYKSLIYDYGFLGFFFIVTWIIITTYFISRNKVFKDWDYFSLLFIFMLSMYQRPLILDASYIVLLFGGISFLKREKNIGGYLYG